MEPKRKPVNENAPRCKFCQKPAMGRCDGLVKVTKSGSRTPCRNPVCEDHGHIYGMGHDHKPLIFGDCCNVD